MTKIKANGRTVVIGGMASNDSCLDGIISSGQFAGVCYASEGFDTIKQQPLLKAIERAGTTASRHHDSVFGHFTINMEIECSKIICMILNSIGVSNTSEKSSRYTKMHPENESEQEKYEKWLSDKGLKRGEYYLIVGRFVPENNYETMIREYMKSHTKKDFAIITNANTQLQEELEEKLHYQKDKRIKFVGTVYDQELLKKIREEAYGYLHGHEVGGTNPSLLEALGSTKLNLLLDVDFNREVAEDSALYWTKRSGNLATLIDKCEVIDREELGRKAKERIRTAYSWECISNRYAKRWVL